MNAYSKISTNPREALRDYLAKVRAGMLGVRGSEQHMQPMTHYPDWDQDRIWFLTSRQTDLVRSLTPGAPAEFCVTDEGHGFDASLRGLLTEDLNREKLDEYWSSVAAAWFKGGKEDPDLTMLRLDLTDAALWGSSNSLIKFGVEILKANLNEEETPDLGVHRVVTF